MSTIAFARATHRAEADPMLAKVRDANQTPEEKASEVAQKLAALVPAEALVVWGIVFAASVETAEEGSTTIKPGEADVLMWAVPALAAASFILYVFQKGRLQWRPLDFVRMFIPPLAFVTWTLLTGSTALALWSRFAWIEGAWTWLVGGALGIVLLSLVDLLTPTTTRGKRLVAAQQRLAQLAE